MQDLTPAPVPLLGGGGQTWCGKGGTTSSESAKLSLRSAALEAAPAFECGSEIGADNFFSSE